MLDDIATIDQTEVKFVELRAQRAAVCAYVMRLRDAVTWQQEK